MSCPECGATPKRPQNVCCSRSCAASLRQRGRTDEANSNWRGGKTKHPLYDVYMDMIGRCERPTHQRYSGYGARGISVCHRWRQDFWSFVADTGPRPAGIGPTGRATFSLDRIDNDGNYEPGNCRWATYSMQSINRRDSAYAGARRRKLAIA